MKSYTKEIDSDTKSNTVFLFTSPTCGQCKILKPRIEKIAAANEAYTFYEVDTSTEEGMDLARKFAVSILPTAVVMSQEDPTVLSGAGQVSGSLSKAL